MSSLINCLSWGRKVPNLGFIWIVVPNKSLSACRCCRGHNHDWIGPALKWIGSKWSVGQPDSARLPLFHFQSERSLQQFPCSALNGWPWPQCKVLRKFENFFASPRDEPKMRTPQVKCQFCNVRSSPGHFVADKKGFWSTSTWSNNAASVGGQALTWKEAFCFNLESISGHWRNDEKWQLCEKWQVWVRQWSFFLICNT